MKKFSNNLLGALIGLLIICLTVGYAAINSKLNINGNTDINSNKWEIYFDNVVENNDSIQAIKTATIENDKTKVNFDIRLEEPGQYYEFNVDVVNKGTIDAMVDQVIKDGFTEDQKYLNFDVTYDDGTALKKCDELKAGATKNLIVKVTYKKNVTEDMLPDTEQILDLGFEIDYIQKTNSCEIPDTPDNPTSSHTLTINPNGGVYNNTSELTKVLLEEGTIYELQTPVKENAAFEGWTAIPSETLVGNIIKMADEDITITANWNDEVVAKINNTYYSSIQKAINAANPNDIITLLKNTVENPNNNKQITLDLNTYTVTGTLTNTTAGNLTIKNGKIENLSSTGIVNNGTLTMGILDDEMEQDSVAIIGNEIGLDQQGIFNFYDGYIEGNIAINGNISNKPDKYYLLIDHNNEKNCQKAYLSEAPASAVAKTIQGVEKYYVNLQDAIDSAAINSQTVYATRDFEAAYTITIAKNTTTVLDIAGYNIATGYSITNNGTFKILDSAETKGTLSPSIAIENNGTLKIDDTNITVTTSANIINNNGNINIANSSLKALAGYAISNTGNGILTMDENTYLSSNKFALYNNSSAEFTIDGGNITGVNSEGALIIKAGTITNNKNNYSILATAPLTINGGNITGDNYYLIYNRNSDIIVNGGTITNQTNNYSIYAKNLTINGGEITGQINVITDLTTNNNPNITSNNTCVIGNSATTTININGGTFNCSRYGISTGKIKMTAGKITATDNAIYGYTTNSEIIAGTIISTTKYGISTGYSITIGSNNSTPNIEGELAAIYADSSANITINSGNIVSPQYGIYNKGTVNIGTDDGNIVSNNPIIIGKLYGLYINGGITNFYDGILKGVTGAYYGTISGVPDGTSIKDGNELVDDTTYQTASLEKEENFVRVDDTEYNSLNQAVSAIQNKGTIQLIRNASMKNVLEIPENKDITLDLNGYSLTSSKEFTVAGVFTVEDSSESQTGVIESLAVNTINLTGTFNLNSGTIQKTTAISTSNFLIYATSGTININGGKLLNGALNKNCYSIINGYGNKAELIINDGEIINEVTANSARAITSVKNITVNGGSVSAYDLVINSSTTIIVNNGTITSTQNGYVILNTSNVTLNGGIINGKVGANSNVTTNNNPEINSKNVCINYQSSSAKININGGTLTCGTIGIYGGNLTMTAGTINAVGNGIDTINTNSSIIINGGKIISTNGYGISQTSGTTTITTDDTTTKDNYPSIEGAKGGIYTKGTLTIGTDDGIIDNNYPEIKGGLYGIYNDGGIVNFYDGILKGTTLAYFGAIHGTPNSYTVASKTDETYNVSYLSQLDNFLKVNDTEYNSLINAIAAIETEGTIEVIANAPISSVITIPENKKITLDLNGHTLTISKEIVNNGEFTLMDSSDNENGAIESLAINAINNSGILNINSGTIQKTTAINATNYLIYTPSGTININGGKLLNGALNKNCYSIINGYGNKAELIINDGEIINEATNSSARAITSVKNITVNGGSVSAYDLVINSSTTIIVNNGTITSTQNGYVILNTSNVTLNGGIINGKVGANSNVTTNNNPEINSKNVCINYQSSSAKININGGTLTCGTIGIYGGNLTMTAGTINAVGNGIEVFLNNTVKISGGKIISTNGYGISQANGTLTIGEQGNLDISTPIIQGNLYGLYISNGTVNFYDGILKGQTAGYYGTITNIEENTYIINDSEIVDDVEYKTNYLAYLTDIIINETNNTKYINIQTAIDEASSGDTLKLISNASVFYPLTIADDNNITLDLAGYTLTTTKKITNNGTFNIIDSSSSQTSQIKCSLAVDLFTNNGTLSMTNFAIEYSPLNNTAIVNNSNLTLKEISITSKNAAIKNNSSGNLISNNTNIKTSTTAVENFGQMQINGGKYYGTNYGIYERSTNTINIVNSYIESSSNSIYNSGATLIFNNTDLIGSIIYNRAPATITGGNIKGSIYNYDEMTIDNITMKDEVLTSKNTYYVISNTGTLNIKNSSINLNIAANVGNYDAINNTGSLNLNNVNISLNKNTTNSTNTKFIENSSKVEIIDSVISLKDNSTTSRIYGISNIKTGTISTTNTSYEISGGRTIYGFYNNTSDNVINMVTGLINVYGAQNAYGIYVNEGEVTIGTYDGSGTEQADVSQTNPSITAIGTASGIGVKKINGLFKYYDGIITGSTNAKPETTTEVEYNYEVKTYISEETGYEYCILEYLKLKAIS